MYLCFQATVIPKLRLEIEAREITPEKPMLCPQVRLQLQSKASNEPAHLSNSQTSESDSSGHCIPVCQAWTGVNCSGRKCYLRNFSAKWRLNRLIFYHLVFIWTVKEALLPVFPSKPDLTSQSNGRQHQLHLLYLHGTQCILHSSKTKSEESSKRYWNQLHWDVYKAVAQQQLSSRFAHWDCQEFQPPSEHPGKPAATFPFICTPH